MEEKYIDGIIIKGIGGFYYVKTNDSIIECHARGKFRKNSLSPIVGDRVTVLMNRDETGSIFKIHERKNFLVRPGVANVDSIILVSAVRSPLPDFFLIDKLLVLAESKGIKGYICLNKTDLAENDDVINFKSVYEKAGYKVICTCAKSHEGMDELKSIIENKTVAFAGLSGVGKSSIISILSETELETGNVSRIERGKHTTRHVELISASGGYVFDTPGFSRLEADELRAENLWQYFPEIKEYHQTCRFRTCNHVGEPGCSVAEALSAGEIAQSRYNSYRMLYDKLKNIKEWERNDNNG